MSKPKCMPQMRAEDVQNQADGDGLLFVHPLRCQGGKPMSMTQNCYCLEGWICEEHPDLPWPHDECTGPGMPCRNGCQFLPVAGLVPAFDIEHDVRTQDTQTPQQPRWEARYSPDMGWYVRLGEDVETTWYPEHANKSHELAAYLNAQQQRIQALEAALLKYEDAELRARTCCCYHIHMHGGVDYGEEGQPCPRCEYHAALLSPSEAI